MSGQSNVLAANELRTVRELLWEVVRASLKPQEVDEVSSTAWLKRQTLAPLTTTNDNEKVMRTIGSSIIDENQSIFDEANALSEILGDIHLSTQSMVQRHKLCSNPQRNLVESEIRSLMGRLRDVASTLAYEGSGVRDRDPEAVIPKSEGKDRAVVDYVNSVTSLQAASLPATLIDNGLEKGSGTQGLGLPPKAPPLTPLTPLLASTPSFTSRPRPSTASSSSSRPNTSQGQTAPPNPSAPPSSSSLRVSLGSRGGGGVSQGSSSSSVQDPKALVQSPIIKEHLNVWGIDQVAHMIREAMAEEKQALLDDVDYLQGLLEEETDLHQAVKQPAPSLQDLKEYSSRLKAAVEVEEGRLEHEEKVGRMFEAIEEEEGRAGRLRGMVAASRGSEADKPVPPPHINRPSTSSKADILEHGGRKEAGAPSLPPPPPCPIAQPSPKAAPSSSSTSGLSPFKPPLPTLLPPGAMRPSSAAGLKRLPSLSSSPNRPSPEMANPPSLSSMPNRPNTDTPSQQAQKQQPQAYQPSPSFSKTSLGSSPSSGSIGGNFGPAAGSFSSSSPKKSNPKTSLVQALDSQVDELLKGGGVEAILAKNKYDPRPGSARKQQEKDKEVEVKSWPKIESE